MEREKLIAALERLAVETGALACLGRGMEHNCSTSGCAIIRAAIETLTESMWVSVDDRLPEDDQMVLTVMSGKPQPNLTLAGSLEIASHSPEGWFVETWPKWEDMTVTYWMPLPEPPEEG